MSSQSLEGNGVLSGPHLLTQVFSVPLGLLKSQTSAFQLSQGGLVAPQPDTIRWIRAPFGELWTGRWTKVHLSGHGVPEGSAFMLKAAQA